MYRPPTNYSGGSPINTQCFWLYQCSVPSQKCIARHPTKTNQCTMVQRTRRMAIAWYCAPSSRRTTPNPNKRSPSRESASSVSVCIDDEARCTHTPAPHRCATALHISTRPHAERTYNATDRHTATRGAYQPGARCRARHQPPRKTYSHTRRTPSHAQRKANAERVINTKQRHARVPPSVPCDEPTHSTQFADSAQFTATSSPLHMHTLPRGDMHPARPVAHVE